jgi:hypothetical protein
MGIGIAVGTAFWERWLGIVSAVSAMVRLLRTAPAHPGRWYRSSSMTRRWISSAEEEEEDEEEEEGADGGSGEEEEEEEEEEARARVVMVVCMSSDYRTSPSHKSPDESTTTQNTKRVEKCG